MVLLKMKSITTLSPLTFSATICYQTGLVFRHKVCWVSVVLNLIVIPSVSENEISAEFHIGAGVRYKRRDKYLGIEWSNYGPDISAFVLTAGKSF